ncbi:hypothetical protein DPMN_037805 [Dreissena polymorpha]|uniref:Uncharacterized protein n=1 Tax=Dreissena polymorpha TaxID=45954 RepID=A0A9D4RN52_DREPO|nr:hypothetical protein DPMN_037805 [Dreissena polymorpha]
MFDLLLPMGETVIDLPILITHVGAQTQFTSSDVLEVTDGLNDSLSGSELPVVTDQKAVEVIKSTLSPELLLKYYAALMSGKDIDDTIYQTRKTFKRKCSNQGTSLREIIEKHFPLPYIKRKTTKIKDESNRYFVISADKLFEENLKKEEQKKRKLERSKWNKRSK